MSIALVSLSDVPKSRVIWNSVKNAVEGTAFGVAVLGAMEVRVGWKVILFPEKGVPPIVANLRQNAERLFARFPVGGKWTDVFLEEPPQ